jgi:hypothetical protein
LAAGISSDLHGLHDRRIQLGISHDTELTDKDLQQPSLDNNGATHDPIVIIATCTNRTTTSRGLAWH